MCAFTLTAITSLCTYITGKFKTGRLDEDGDIITADKLYELLLQSDHDKVVTTEVMSDDILEALLDRGICKKPAIPNRDTQDDTLQNDKTKKNFFKVLEETDDAGKDLQGINSENTTQPGADEPMVDTSSS